jgi:hypothetical protein
MEKKNESRLTRIEDLSAVGSEVRELDQEQLRLVEGGQKPRAWTRWTDPRTGTLWLGPQY